MPLRHRRGSFGAIACGVGARVRSEVVGDDPASEGRGRGVGREEQGQVARGVSEGGVAVHGCAEFVIAPIHFRLPEGIVHQIAFTILAGEGG